MPFTVSTPSGPLRIDAEEHRVEGRSHVFRRTTLVMGRPRVMVVRRLPLADVLSVTNETRP